MREKKFRITQITNTHFVFTNSKQTVKVEYFEVDLNVSNSNTKYQPYVFRCSVGRLFACPCRRTRRGGTCSSGWRPSRFESALGNASWPNGLAVPEICFSFSARSRKSRRVDQSIDLELPTVWRGSKSGGWGDRCPRGALEGRRDLRRDES